MPDAYAVVHRFVHKDPTFCLKEYRRMDLLHLKSLVTHAIAEVPGVRMAAFGSALSAKFGAGAIVLLKELSHDFRPVSDQSDEGIVHDLTLVYKVVSVM